MGEGEPVGMKGESRCGRGDPRVGVEPVTEDRTADRFHMDADLVQAAGHGATLHQGGAHVLSQYAVGSLGLAAAGGGGDDGQFFVTRPLWLDLGDGLVDEADVLIGGFVADRPVKLADLALLEILAELVVGLGREGDDQQPGRFTVEPVEQAEIAGLAKVLEFGAVVKVQAVEQRVIVMPEAGLRD